MVVVTIVTVPQYDGSIRVSLLRPDPVLIGMLKFPLKEEPDTTRSLLVILIVRLVVYHGILRLSGCVEGMEREVTIRIPEGITLKIPPVSFAAVLLHVVTEEDHGIILYEVHFRFPGFLLIPDSYHMFTPLCHT